MPEFKARGLATMVGTMVFVRPNPIMCSLSTPKQLSARLGSVGSLDARLRPRALPRTVGVISPVKGSFGGTPSPSATGCYRSKGFQAIANARNLPNDAEMLAVEEKIPFPLAMAAQGWASVRRPPASIQACLWHRR
jgi:hypothetical protein